MVHNTNNDVGGTLLEHINIEGNDEEVETKMDNTIKNDVDYSSPESLINEENNDEEVEQKMDNTIQNDVDFSSPESLINEENNDEENTQSPDSTPSESVTDTPNEKPTDSDSETEKQSKNEEIEKKADDSYGGKVSQGGVRKKAKIFEEKYGIVPNACTTPNWRNT
eukprot:XP_011449436.1 PREDICTED: enolase-phosphatase E1-like isoform X2 [Crassostrea gigas]